MENISNLKEAKAAEASVALANADLKAALPFADREDFDDAARGFIDTVPDARAKRSRPGVQEYLLCK